MCRAYCGGVEIHVHILMIDISRVVHYSSRGHQESCRFEIGMVFQRLPNSVSLGLECRSISIVD